jgi:hypothetical protein
MNPKACCKCGNPNNIERHHVLPKRYFRGSGGKVPLCVDCHFKVEQLIRKAEIRRKPNGKRKLVKLSKEQYLLIMIYFIKS